MINLSGFRSNWKKTPSRFESCCASAAIAVLALVNSGCGELVSGANFKPPIVYKPSTTEVAAAQVRA